MFYKNQPTLQQEQYKKMLSIIGNLTILFSEGDCPYLPYRVHENIFCKYFHVENLARRDCSADAKSDNIGIGLKIWTGNNDQKVAEFGLLQNTYKELKELDLVLKISNYRNERIRVTMNLYGLKKMIYHIVKRIPGTMQIFECAFDYINIEKIKLLSKRGNKNNTYFTDGNHTYHFSTSKNTLYMIFDKMEKLDSFNVDIMSDPYVYLMNLAENVASINTDKNTNLVSKLDRENKICLRLYSEDINGNKSVHEKSSLNQWNAGGRKRDKDEIYINFPVKDRARNGDFFPKRDTQFNLRLPDGTYLKAKICQENGKAIMSNPNKDLGKWLLRKVFNLKKNELLTYEMLEIFGIDSVVFTKISELNYEVDFSEIGTYDLFYEKAKI